MRYARSVSMPAHYQTVIQCQYRLVNYPSVKDTPTMPAKDAPIVSARRARLREWIDGKYEGRQVQFIAEIGINQGELSALLKPGGKSFGEKKALALERKAKMPKGYLVAPMAEDPKIPGNGRTVGEAVNDIENEMIAIKVALGSILSVMVRHRPAEAAELAEALQQVPDQIRDSDLIQTMQTHLLARGAKARPAS